MNGVQLRQLDFNLIKVLDVIAQESSIERTARRLAVTPSAVSHSLRRLRLLLRDAIVVRSGRALSLTPRALALARQARAVCEAAREVLNSNEELIPSLWDATIRVSGSDYALTQWVFPILPLTAKIAPALSIAALVLDAVQWERQLIDGTADMSIRNERPTNPKLRWQTIATESYVTVMRIDHPYAHGRLTLSRYCAAKHGLVSVMSGNLTGTVDDALTNVGKHRSVVASAPTFLAGIDLARQSDLLVSIPRRMAQRYRHIVVAKPIPIRIPTFEVTLVWHSRTEQSAPHRWFRNQIKIASTNSTAPVLPRGAHAHARSTRAA